MLKTKETYVVAVVGATGAVGNELISLLEERRFPVERLQPFASERSEGEAIEFEGSELPVETLTEDSFAGVDIAFFSAGAEQSKRWAPVAARAGCVVVDTSSGWRMDPAVPLVVPEVNAAELARHKGIIASPAPSTVQIVTTLKPLHDAARVRRVVATLLQSVSGTGKKAMDELLQQTANLLSFREITPSAYPHQIAFNLLPHVGAFLDNGATTEERHVAEEAKRVMGDGSLRVAATAVQAPVFRGHAASLNIETEKELTANEARSLLAGAPGVTVFDAPEKRLYPLPIDAAGKDGVYVGRIREDESVERGLALWVVTDNLRKGAALNALQIAEELVRQAHP